MAIRLPSSAPARRASDRRTDVRTFVGVVLAVGALAGGIGVAQASAPDAPARTMPAHAWQCADGSGMVYAGSVSPADVCAP